MSAADERPILGDQNNKDWMAQLSEQLWDIPLYNLAIPGTRPIHVISQGPMSRFFLPQRGIKLYLCQPDGGTHEVQNKGVSGRAE